MAKNAAKNADWPKIVSRRATRVSPWVEIVEREVEFTPGAKPDVYHAISQTDYVAVVARTPDGTIPIVRQFRPALENFTWELPAGMLDKDELPLDCCRRELLYKRHTRSAVTRPARHGFRTKSIRSLSRPDHAPIHWQSRPASNLNLFHLMNWPGLFWPKSLCFSCMSAPSCSPACMAIST
jgi:NUDIX domain-containing protein